MGEEDVLKKERSWHTALWLPSITPRSGGHCRRSSYKITPENSPEVPAWIRHFTLRPAKEFRVWRLSISDTSVTFLIEARLIGRLFHFAFHAVLQGISFLLLRWMYLFVVQGNSQIFWGKEQHLPHVIILTAVSTNQLLHSLLTEVSIIRNIWTRFATAWDIINRHPAARCCTGTVWCPSYHSNTFSGRWIGRGSDMAWLPRQTDVTSCENSL